MTKAESVAVSPGIGSTPVKWVAITFDTPLASGDILRGFRLQAATAKDVAVTQLDGTSLTIKLVQPGQTVPGLFLNVNTTNTTATAAELLGYT